MELAQVLRHIPAITDPAVLVGSSTKDDAAVYRLSAGKALVFTTDFFTPVVDDPYSFGRIAASNALSDVYAMGARPLMALNIVSFPARKVPLEILGKIIEGGAAAANEAGMPIVGGHSIDDPEPKYGMAILGMGKPDRLLANAGARPKDFLVLTKPLGSGIITTAIKKAIASEKEIEEVIEIMAALNKDASAVLMRNRKGVNACTDITGFGLLGHLLEMLEASGVKARLSVSKIPILKSARKYAEDGVMPGGSRANLLSVSDRLSYDGFSSDDKNTQLMLADAQTSGGLLASVSPAYVNRVVKGLQRAGTPAAAVIGEIIEGKSGITLVD